MASLFNEPLDIQKKDSITYLLAIIFDSSIVS